LVDLGRRRRPGRRVARFAWPAAVGAAGLAWYGADSLRHRRESGHGYDLRGAVGSANFDNRSFQLNHEATLCVSSEDVARRLTKQLERDLEVSERISPDRWQGRGPLQRTGETALKLARREL
jgi:phosphatidylserine/phosphatidylglycerophosphate/cardiolipin synthase-like enzyme